MTTKTDITLPELPGGAALRLAQERGMPAVMAAMQTYARAAVEADRQCRMPSDAELDDLSDEFHGYSGNHTRDGYLIPKFDHIGYARALLSRYGSSQPTTNTEPTKRPYAQSATLGEYGIIPECDTQPAASVEPRPDEYDYFVDWYDEEAPDENEVRNFDMARYAWLAGVRFADRFPVAACAAREKA